MYSNSSRCKPGTHFLGLKAFFQQVGKIGISIFFYGLLPEYSFLTFEGLFSASEENGNKCLFVLAVTRVLISSFWRPFFRQMKKIYEKRELFSSKNFYSCAWHVPGIGTCPVYKITLVLGKNDLRQADNSGFPGVNHPCLFLALYFPVKENKLNMDF